MHHKSRLSGLWALIGGSGTSMGTSQPRSSLASSSFESDASAFITDISDARGILAAALADRTYLGKTK